MVNKAKKQGTTYETNIVNRLNKNNKEVLIPFVKEIVTTIDQKNNYLIIDPPKGLLDL